MLKQTDLFDFLGKENDSVFRTIKNLEKGDCVLVGEFKVCFTLFSLYEICSPSFHEVYSSLDDCYEGVNQLITVDMLLKTG